MKADAWSGAERILDESACPICLSERCEGHDPASTSDNSSGSRQEVFVEDKLSGKGHEGVRRFHVGP